jgi:hypothetical protein
MIPLIPPHLNLRYCTTKLQAELVCALVQYSVTRAKLKELLTGSCPEGDLTDRIYIYYASDNKDEPDPTWIPKEPLLW